MGAFIDFFQNEQLILVENLPLATCRAMCFQCYDCLVHYAREMRSYLTQAYPEMNRPSWHHFVPYPIPRFNSSEFVQLRL